MKTLFPFILLIMACTTILAASAATQTQKLPNPLSIVQALSYAQQHPAVKLSAEERKHFVAVNPLYLNCHRLAYSNDVAVDYQRNASFSELVDPEVAQELRIMQRFFDVLLADASVMADNESMAIAYVRLDRAKSRMELKQLSEVQVAALEARYQDTLQRYKGSSELQHLSRAYLAQAIAHVGQLPRDLKTVNPIQLPTELPEVSELLQQAHDNNSWLAKQRENRSASLRQVQDMQLRLYVTELLARLKMLKAAQQHLDKTASWRDLALEQSRTLYEQEARSDLGDSMAEQTRVQFQIQQISFCQILTWARLNALQGKPILTRQQTKPEKATKATP